jgi:acetolactate synthase-1/2/3 large subunit
MSANGRGGLDDRHPLALTWLAGRAALAVADLVLGVGSRFLSGQEQLGLAPGARCVLLNAEPNDLAAPRQPTVAILGDAALGLDALADELAGTAMPARRIWLDLDHVRGWAEDLQAQVEPQYSWVRALRASLPEDGILVNEFTQVGYLSQAAFPVYHPRTYISPGYQGTLGYGFPTALGARVANPDRAVLSISGDGGFGWALPELSTARKFGIGLVTVVFNDQAYGNVRRAQVEQFGGRIFGSELLNPDFVELAESFGVRGARASTPGELEGLLRETLGASAEPVLIDVPVGVMPQPFRRLRESPVPKIRPPAG